MGLDEPRRAWTAFTMLGNLLRDLGVHESLEKSVTPTMVIEFLGIIFDLIRRLLILPEDKMCEIKKELQNWRQKQWATKKQFQKLAGKLQFTALCVRPGRVFVSRLYDMIAELQDGAIVKINRQVRSDLYWWEKFLIRYNRVSMLWLESVEGEEAFATDATLQGISGFYNGKYFMDTIQDQQAERKQGNIVHMEMIAIMIALKLWLKEFTMKKLIIECDNMAVLEVINQGKAKDKTLQRYLREIAYLCTINQCEIKIRYIRSERNIIPDMLSRYYTSQQKKQQFQKKLCEHKQW